MKKILLFSALTIFLNSCTVEVRIDGCTDPCAANFDPLADDNDGSCLYSAGCTDPSAINYDQCAAIDDGSCVYMSGCTDPLADNYNQYADVEELNDCQYSCNLVYYLDYSAAQYMINWGISYYTFYDSYNDYIGYITSDYYWTSPPNCIPQADGSTLTATLYWNGNYNNNLGSFSWSAYPDDGLIADYDYTENNIVPGECIKLQLSKKKIQEYKEATK